MLEFRDRVLCLKGTLMPLDKNGLFSFSSNFWESFNPNILDMERFSHIRRAVILAEGGMGKTTLMEELKKRFYPGENGLLINFSELHAEALEREIDFFLTRQADNTQEKCILIDGIDEHPGLFGPLCRKLRQIQENVKIWLSSRECPEMQFFKRNMENNEMTFSTYLLAPFSRSDICWLTKSSKIDSDIFMTEVEKLGLTAFCASPIGCELLLNVYKSESTLCGKTLDDIWEKGIRRLCDQQTKPQGSSKGISYALTDIFNCAIRIALYAALSGKLIFCGFDTESDAPAESLTLSDLASDKSHVDLLKTTLQRGLFSPCGDGCVRFVHATYLDYLTARALREEQVSQENLQKLLFDGDEKTVYPQREGIATWLSRFYPEIKNEILQKQPELLLSPQAIGDVDHRELCRRLVERVDKIGYYRMEGKAALFRLKKEQIESILEDYLREDSTTDEQQRLVSDIVIKTQCNNLAKFFAERTLETERSLEKRVEDARVVANLNNEEAKRRLRNLLPIDPDLDKQNKLRGYLFYACWPDYLSVQELLDNLIVPRDFNTAGIYEFFFSYHLSENLHLVGSEEARALLSWAVNQMSTMKSLSRLERLVRSIYTYCWRWANTPGITKLLAEGYKKALAHGNTPFIKSTNITGLTEPGLLSVTEFKTGQKERFAVLEALLNITESQHVWKFSYFSFSWIKNEYPLYTETDMDLLFDKLLDIPQSSLASRWARLIHIVAEIIPELEPYKERLDRAHKMFPEIIPTFEIIQTNRQKQEKMQQKNVLEINKKIKSEDNSLRLIEIIRKDLSKEKLDSSVFASIAHKCCFKQEVQDRNMDITQGNVWNYLSHEEKKRYIKLANEYLLNYKYCFSTSNENNIEPSVVYALTLLRLEDIETYENLPEAIWRECSVELLKWVGLTGGNIRECVKFPVEKLLSFPEVVIESLFICLNIKDYIIPQILEIWGNRLTTDIADRLISMVFTSGIEKQKSFDFLLALMEHGLTPLVQKHLEQSPDTYRGLRIDDEPNMYLLLLWNIAHEKYSDIILRMLELCPLQGREWIQNVIAYLMDDSRKNSLMPTIAPTFIARLYIWLHKEFPLNARPIHEGCYSPVAIDYIYDFKDRLIRRLSQEKETASASALKKIAATFPSETYWKNLISEAEENELYMRTIFLSLKSLKELTEGKKEIIASSEGLHKFILRLLQKDYQDHLQKGNAAVEDLWNIENETDKNKSELKQKSAKNEEKFCNHIKRYLDSRLSTMVINREPTIEFKKYKAGKPGSRLDILIQSLGHDKKPIGLCLEVKGDWNVSAKDALHNQLINKYLSSGEVNSGILVVGWFDSPHKKRVWKSKERAEENLQHQVEEAKRQGYCVDACIIDCRLI